MNHVPPSLTIGIGVTVFGLELAETEALEKLEVPVVLEGPIITPGPIPGPIKVRRGG